MKRWTGSVMTLQHFQDFYYLEALQAKMTMAKSANPENLFRKGFVKLDEDIQKAFQTLCERMALHIYVYLWVAALGEAVYADYNCEQRIAEQHGGWSDTDALDYFPNDENVEIVKTIFGQDWSGGGYGGDAWEDIVEAMDMYNKVPHSTFIDHAVDLEHNGGNVFDKTNAEECGLNCFTPGYGKSGLQNFLDIKFKNDILNNNKYNNGWGNYKLQIDVSMKVYDLIVRYSNIVEKVKAVNFLKPTLEWLTPYSVNWEYQDFSLESANGGLKCAWCGDSIDADYCHNFRDEDICDYCYDHKVVSCEKCGEDALSDDTEDIYSGNHNEVWCYECVSSYAVDCEDCGCKVDEEHNTVRTEDDFTICKDCAEKMFCEECNEYYYHIEAHNEEEHPEPIELPVDSDGIFSPVALEEA